MRRFLCWTVVFCATVQGPIAFAFQIAPLGSSFESRLTNEKESRLSLVAGALGVLVKLPVHEEITQLGFGCPVERADLENNDSCKGGDTGFANHFIIYGVRWNDLPPFKLNKSQGAGCKRLGFLDAPACNVEQTIRFSTQPDCWYCLFSYAQKRSASKKVTGCENGQGFEQGNLMTRSHFGDLQFLHSMERDDGTPAEVTRRKVLGWLEFAWKVFLGDIGPDTLLRDINVPVIKEHFGCSGWSVADIYIQGRNDSLRRRLSDIAFGSVLHTVQDSFASGHVTRELSSPNDVCPIEPRVPRPGRIVEFHAYGLQDAHTHDREDSRAAMVTGTGNRWPEAVEATKQLFEFYDSNAPWEKTQAYLECIFELSPNNKPASPGKNFVRN